MSSVWRTLAGPVEEPARLAFLMDALRAEDDAWVRGEGMRPGRSRRRSRAVEAAGGDGIWIPPTSFEVSRFGRTPHLTNGPI